MCYGKFVKVRRLLCGEGALLPPLRTFWENQTQTARLAQQVFYPLSFLTGPRDSHLKLRNIYLQLKG